MGGTYDYVTETIHEAAVEGGDVEGVVDGKSVKIDIKTLRQTIPAHCFRPSTIRSLSFVLRDATIFLAILYGTLWLAGRLGYWSSLVLRVVAYPYLASLPLTGFWVLAHECGHGAFSPKPGVEHTVGFVLHSALLAPYFAWRSSHARHHQFANNMSTDLNYVPPARTEYRELLRGKIDLDHMAEDAPVVVFLRILLQQLIGWPWYLWTHITAGPDSSPRKSRGWWDNNHFLPSSSLFRPNESRNIFLSDVGIGAWCYVLYLASQKFGYSTVFWTYVLPWMWVNHWIVMITYLHHTSPYLPKYTPESWTYLRGALATVDRDPGWALRHAFHHVIDLHVIHHLFPQEATDAIKPLLGPHYHADKGSYWRALWTAFTQCQWVQADPGKTRSANLHSNADGAVEQEAAGKEDDHGVLWYNPGPMPRPATTMRSRSHHH
ncbi:fatty acid desaturase-domain-containing protein [Xylariomycetidae sp. FL0641]|nr:fatty acid desaturase-domain-containing protein [Xylariomycetidae sp. FL0641]